jgi:hypothetical protein
MYQGSPEIKYAMISGKFFGKGEAAAMKTQVIPSTPCGCEVENSIQQGIKDKK